MLHTFGPPAGTLMKRTPDSFTAGRMLNAWHSEPVQAGSHWHVLLARHMPFNEQLPLHFPVGGAGGAGGGGGEGGGDGGGGGAGLDVTAPLVTFNFFFFGKVPSIRA